MHLFYKRGFTLIELLIVIVIIGILATLAVPAYNKLILQSKFAEAYTFIGTINRAQTPYYMEAGEYADDLTKLTITLPPRSMRNFAYSIDVDTAIADPPGFGYNDYIIIAHPNSARPGMSGVVEHPHAHSSGPMGIWRSATEPHSHGSEFSHTHDIEYGTPY